MGMGRPNSKLVFGGKDVSKPTSDAASTDLANALAKPDITDDMVKKAARGGLSKLRSGYGRKGTFLVGDAFGNTLGG